MVLLSSKLASEYNNFKLPNFCLKNTDGSMISSKDIVGKNGLLVAFICNHCPYVKAIKHDIVSDAKELANIGINTVCINSNDSSNLKYEEDSFDNMKIFSNENGFVFPYLIDETQEVAKEFDAVCTPDFFLFVKNDDSECVLNYKGRLNNFIYTKSGDQSSESMKNMERTLLNYAKAIILQPMPAMGCSIKWKEVV